MNNVPLMKDFLAIAIPLLLCSPVLLLIALSVREAWRGWRNPSVNTRKRFWRKKYELRALGRTARLLGR